MIPHDLANCAVNAICTDDDIPSFDAAIIEVHLYATGILFYFFDCSPAPKLGGI